MRLAAGVWLLFALIVGLIVAIQPDRHTVTPEYRTASEKWWAGKESPYNMSQIGYLYLPQEAMIYTPYRLLPKRLGEPLWRFTGLALLAAGLWRVARLLDPARKERLFLVATLLVIPASCASAQDGQVNLPLAGLLLLTVAELSHRRWNLATLWLLLAIMLKPIALAPTLLAAACFPPLRPRLLGGFILCLVVAYLHPSTAYVSGEYHHFWSKFVLAGQPLVKENFSDLFGMLWHWDIHPSPAIISGIRALASFVTLLLSLSLMRSFRGDQVLQSFGVLLLSALYLMLFNPRTEENSYVILVGFSALLAARDFLSGNVPRGSLLVLFCLLLAVDSYGFTYALTKIWFKPLVTLTFFVVLVAGKFSLLESSSRDVRSDD